MIVGMLFASALQSLNIPDLCLDKCTYMFCLFFVQLKQEYISIETILINTALSMLWQTNSEELVRPEHA